MAEKGYPKYVAHADRPQKGKVYINKDQYFEGVRPEVWEFHIGGYQVCEKWLKDRRQRELSYEDKSHYEKIVVALGETIRLMKHIDEVIAAHGGWSMNPGEDRGGEGQKHKGNIEFAVSEPSVSNKEYRMMK